MKLYRHVRALKLLFANKSTSSLHLPGQLFERSAERVAMLA